jgi:pyridoxamine 5'-phosphate oxidase
MSVANLRRDYARAGLTEADADADPVRQFHVWFEQARAAEITEPNAVTLATCTPEGIPSARIVLLKAYDERGFVVFTNYESRKGRELTANPNAALVFYWAELERQVRVEGRAERTGDAESDAYFASRPRGSRLGAWASRQSEVVPDRATLDAAMAEVEARFPGEAVPRPPYWGGVRVVPAVVEFWQGRPSRMHDRLRYTRTPGGWLRERLAP